MTLEEINAAHLLHLIENTGHAFLLAEYTEQLTACKIGIEIIDRELEVS